MVDIQSPTTEIRRGKKERRKKKERNHRCKTEWRSVSWVAIKCCILVTIVMAMNYND